MLANLKLDPARTKLIGGFVDSYLELTAQELKQFERAIAAFMPVEREATMEITTSWERMGISRELHRARKRWSFGSFVAASVLFPMT